MKLNLLAFTLSIELNKQPPTRTEWERGQRLKEIHDRHIDQRSKIYPFM